jgi:hypothetical protein
MESSLLMLLKVVLTKGRKATEAGFFGAIVILVSGLRTHQICWSLQTLCLKVALRNCSSLCRLSWSQGSGRVHKHGKYSLFVGRMVVTVVVEVEVSVCGFAINLTAQ